MAQTLSIIMPAYNEGGCIFDNIRMTLEVMLDAGIDNEIIAVDDGSSDNTLDEIHRAAETFENIVEVKNPYNMGKGMALRNGFEHSKGEIVVFLDADLDLYPSQIIKLIEVLENTPCDIVVTSKHHPDSHLNYPFSRTAASWIYYLIIKSLFNLPVRDTQTGLKVFRREALEKVMHRLLVKKFAYDVELLATAVRFGFTVREVPVVLDFKRNLKWGRIRFEDILSLFIDTAAVFYRLKIMKYYDNERPGIAHEKKSVLVVVRGWPLPDEIMKRLTADNGASIACISKNAINAGEDIDVPAFPDYKSLLSWLAEETCDVEIVGFLGRDCLPLGSWVKYAARNFDDPSVGAVCGPTLPGSFSSLFEKAAGHVFSSVITRGADSYLYSFRPFQTVDRGLKDNIFFRAELLLKDPSTAESTTISGRFVSAGAGVKWSMKYDPDVSVVKKIPPLFLPYIRNLAGEVFSDSSSSAVSNGIFRKLQPLMFTVIWLFILAGWAVVPCKAYVTAVTVYAAVVFITALTCLSPIVVPFFALGILCSHIVRAVVFPAGLIKGIIKRK